MADAESLIQEFNFLTDLLHKHKIREAYYQRPKYHSAPYRNQSLHKRTRLSNFSDSSVYNSKYHTGLASSRNHSDDKTSKDFKSNYLHKQAVVSVIPNHNKSCSAKQGIPWKFSKVPYSMQRLPNSSFKMVRTSNSCRETNVSSTKVTDKNSTNGKSDTFVKEQTAVHESSEKECAQPLKKAAVPSKLRKGAKVSYVSCSDCVIEISEFENGELHISQKKVEPSAQNNKQNTAEALDNSFSGSDVPTGSVLGGSVLNKSVTDAMLEMHVGVPTSQFSNSVYPKPVIGSHCSKETVKSSNVKADIKLSSVSSTSQKGFISSPCKSSKSGLPCVRNAKYRKINNSSAKSLNSFARPVVKNKYSVKKANVIRCYSRTKCTMNRGVKKCSPRPLKYTFVAKSSTEKCLVNSVTTKVVLSPVKNVDRSAITTSGHLNSLEQNCTNKKFDKISAIKPGLSTLSIPQVSRKSKDVHMKNAYKIVNRISPFVGSIVKSSPMLCKGPCEKNITNLMKHGDHGSDKKWFKSNGGSRTAPHSSLNADLHQNSSGSHLVKSEHKMLYSKKATPHKTSNYKLKNVPNGSKIVSHHSLQRFPEKKILFKKARLSPSYKSLSYSHIPIKKAKKVRLSKTAYKIVNKHNNHVSQVVQMIKTKYRTVNKRSASNSHLKWLHEQKRTYAVRKLKTESCTHAKVGWTYSHSSVEHLRKCPVLRTKASRKHSLGQNKVLKKIHGVTYKVSKTQINKSCTPKTVRKGCLSLCNTKNSVVINIHGTKFQMAPGGKSLKKLGTSEQGNEIPLRRIKIGGFTYVQQKESPDCLVRFSSPTQNLASRMLHRSIHTVRVAEAKKKTVRKSNTFCMFFNRFGRCNKGGTCPYIHDPSKIAVCTRFLRGTCKIDGCPFSHEVSPGKMAICSFFVQGNCTNNSCPYQHTRIKPVTRLCKAFVKGYCSNGDQCQDAHILSCPQLMCQGFCEKGTSCLWPHPPVKKSIKERTGSSEVSKEIKEEEAVVDDVSGDLRYFTYEPGLVSDKCIKQTESVENNTQHNKAPKIKHKKITFPKQPEFIPLLVSDEEL